MNCKPGDLAVVVRAGGSPEMLGLMCLVTSVGEFDHEGRWTWLCRFQKKTQWDIWVEDVRTGRETMSRNGFMPDSDLRPIRNPGDDATDETLLWLPTPSKERETV